MKYTSLRPAHGGLAPSAGLNLGFLDTLVKPDKHGKKILYLGYAVNWLLGMIFIQIKGLPAIQHVTKSLTV